jgi:hypothetical protein
MNCGYPAATAVEERENAHVIAGTVVSNFTARSNRFRSMAGGAQIAVIEATVTGVLGKTWRR